jgi:hypothetical protein
VLAEMSSSEETIATLVAPEDYAYHTNQVATVGSESLRILRKKVSVTTPYVLETVPMLGCRRVDYQFGLSWPRIVAGTLLVVLLLCIIFFIGVYWSSFQAGQSIPVGALLIALIFGLRWAFLSKSHRLIFSMHDGTRYVWRSRPGEFKGMERAVSNVLEFAGRRGLRYNVNERT